jgi:hypothetical protein
MVFETESILPLRPPTARRPDPCQAVADTDHVKFLRDRSPCEAPETGVRLGMPAADLVPYCTPCDEGRNLLAAGAESEEARAAILREHPRRLATKTDIVGTPMCARCLEYAAKHRTAGFYFEQQDCPRDSVF